MRRQPQGPKLLGHAAQALARRHGNLDGVPLRMAWALARADVFSF